MENIKKAGEAEGCVIKKCTSCVNLDGYWYCPECEEEILPCRVPNNETCSDCGTVLEYRKINWEGQNGQVS